MKLLVFFLFIALVVAIAAAKENEWEKRSKGDETETAPMARREMEWEKGSKGDEIETAPKARRERPEGKMKRQDKIVSKLEHAKDWTNEKLEKIQNKTISFIGRTKELVSFLFNLGIKITEKIKAKFTDSPVSTPRPGPNSGSFTLKGGPDLKKVTPGIPKPRPGMPTFPEIIRN